MYTEQQLKEYARKQREICADVYKRRSQGGLSTFVLNAISAAPEPELPEIDKEKKEAAKFLDEYYQPKMHWNTVNRNNVIGAMVAYAAQFTK